MLREDIYSQSMLFLKVYKEIKYLNISKSSFDYIGFILDKNEKSVAACVDTFGNRKRCNDLALSRWEAEDRKSELELKTLKLMDKALEEVKNEKYIYVLRLLYFEQESFSNRINEICETLNIKKSRFYALKNEALNEYAGCLFNIFYESDIDFQDTYLKIEECLNMHMPHGICYESTKSLLKNYKKLKFDQVVEREIDKKLYDWTNSSMMENTYSYLIILEEVLRRMKKIKGGRVDYATIIEMSYFTKGICSADVMDKMNLTGRMYYTDRVKAVTLFSKILWGFSGLRFKYE